MTGFRPFLNPATGEWIEYTASAQDNGELSASAGAVCPDRRGDEASTPPGRSVHLIAGRPHVPLIGELAQR